MCHEQAWIYFQFDSRDLANADVTHQRQNDSSSQAHSQQLAAAETRISQLEQQLSQQSQSLVQAQAMMDSVTTQSSAKEQVQPASMKCDVNVYSCFVLF